MSYTKYKLNPETKRLHRRVNNVDVCELQDFVLNADRDRLEQIQQENINKLFECCKHMKIPRIYIGKSELVGADNTRELNGSWPAVWRLSEELDGASYSGNEDAVGYRAGCGNGDQAQTQDAHIFFPHKYVGKAWNVETRKQMNEEPFKKNWVVSRHEW